MEYAPKLKQSFSGMWNNKSLWSVLILELILVTVVGVLFLIGDIAVIAYINRDALSAGLGAPMDLYALLNTKTYLVGGLLLLVQGLIFVYLDSFFKAGFIGMAKNFVRDGSTAFAEFIPEAKRFWYPMFRLTLVRYIVLTVAAIPAFFALLSFLGTTPEFVQPSQLLYLLGALAVFGIIASLTYFWLLYSEACIAFDDMQALESMKTSWRMAKDNAGTSVVIMLITFLVFIAASAVSTALVLPLDLAINPEAPQQGLVYTRDAVNFLLNILTIMATVVTTIFVFLAYQELTVVKAARKAPVSAGMPRTTIKRKR